MTRSTTNSQQTGDAQSKFYSAEAESALNGAILVDATSLIPAIATGLAPADFYVARQRWIYDAITRLHKGGRAIDLATVAATLAEMGKLDDCGGREYLHDLAGQTFSAANSESYVSSIKRHSIRRAAIKAVEEMARLAAEDDGDDMDAFLDRISHPLSDVTRNLAGARRTATLTAGYDKVFEYLATEDRGLETGLTDLDARLGGLLPENYYILAARPGMGKSTLAHQAALHIIRNAGVPTLLVSMEMSLRMVAARFLAMESGVSVEKINKKQLTEDEVQSLVNAAAAARAHSDRLTIMDSPYVTPEQIRAQALTMKYGGGLGLIIVDYIGLVESGRDEAKRQESVAYISRRLKAMTLEFGIPVVALSQLNREVEGRHDKRPQQSDLRDSGTLEQDADVLLFIYRDEVYNADSEKPNVAEILVRKNRNGGDGAVEVYFQKTTPEFQNLETHTVPLNE